MTNAIYPLEQILGVKKRRVEEAEKVVQDCKQALKREQEKLVQLQKASDAAKAYYDQKLTQLREALDTAGQSTAKLAPMRVHLQGTKDKWEQEQKKVKEQEKQIEEAEKKVEAALEALKEKRKDLDKIEMHKKEWMKSEHKELLRLEGIEQDELGVLIHESRQQQKRQREK